MMDKQRIRKFLMIYGEGTKLLDYKLKDEQYGLTPAEIDFMKSERLIIPTGIDGQYIVTAKANEFTWNK